MRSIQAKEARSITSKCMFCTISADDDINTLARPRSGANGLAAPRDFQTPVAWYEERACDFTILHKLGGQLYQARPRHAQQSMRGDGGTGLWPGWHCSMFERTLPMFLKLPRSPASWIVATLPCGQVLCRAGRTRPGHL